MTLAHYIKEDLIHNISNSFRTSHATIHEFLNLSKQEKPYGEDNHIHFMSNAFVIDETHQYALLIKENSPKNSWKIFSSHWNSQEYFQNVIYQEAIKKLIEISYDKIPQFNLLNNHSPIFLYKEIENNHEHYCVNFLVSIDKNIPLKEHTDFSLVWIELESILHNRHQLFPSNLSMLAENTYFSLGKKFKNQDKKRFTY